MKLNDLQTAEVLHFIYYPFMHTVTVYVCVYIYYTAAVSTSCWMLQGSYVLPRLQEWYKRLELTCVPTDYTGRPQDTFGDRSKWFPVCKTL